MNSIKLGVNIDHVATVREARKSSYPSVLEAALICDDLNVNGITIHLREDRRHIQDKDVFDIRKSLKNTKLNLEMALSDDIIAVALKSKPEMATIVPEKRQEITTEGGLDIRNNFSKLKDLCLKFNDENIHVSMFIEPDKDMILYSKDCNAKYVEFHTGSYAEADEQNIDFELERLYKAAEIADNEGLIVNAGHGLNIYNVKPILKMKNLYELNIGHSIISRAIFIGLENAVKEMKSILEGKI